MAKSVAWQWSTIHPTRDLHLVRLDDIGLAALGTTRADLIETGRPSYPTGLYCIDGDQGKLAL